MEVEQLLTCLLVFGLYPLWLLAGGIDYACHRWTRIEATAGPKESLLHVAEFLVLGAALALVICFSITRLTFFMVVAGVTLHSLLAYVDVTYTNQRRYIPPLEQLIHGLLNDIPWFAVALLAVLHWDALTGKTPAIPSLDTSMPLRQQLMVVGSYLTLAGIPIVEELIRTLRRPVRAAPGVDPQRTAR
jgi:hypothetical protein